MSWLRTWVIKAPITRLVVDLAVLGHISPLTQSTRLFVAARKGPERILAHRAAAWTSRSLSLGVQIRLRQSRFCKVHASEISTRSPAGPRSPLHFPGWSLSSDPSSQTSILPVPEGTMTIQANFGETQVKDRAKELLEVQRSFTAPPNGRRALPQIPSTEGRSVCLCWAKSEPKGRKALRCQEPRRHDQGSREAAGGDPGVGLAFTRL